MDHHHSSRLCLAFAASVAFTTILANAGMAQNTRPKASITIAPVVLAVPTLETELPIAVGPREALPSNSFLRIRGVPPQAVFSDGHFVANGTWALPLSRLSQLTLTLPLTSPERAELQLTLLTIDGTVLAEARTTISVTTSVQGGASASLLPPQLAVSRPSSSSPGGGSGVGPSVQSVPLITPRIEPPAPLPAAPVPVPPPAAEPSLSQEKRERAVKLIARGNTEFAGGDVAAARLLYLRAVDAGLAEGAMAMGRSYDPIELANRGVKGLKGDPATARTWYERARALGASGVEERLLRLAAP
jgi:hypothetical protein